MKSVYFNKRALKALTRIGDILIPKNGDFPSFSEYGGLEHIDKLVSYAPSDDIGDLNLALAIFSFLPNFMLRFIVVLCANSAKYNNPLAPTLRQLNLAIRGLVFSCYYSERSGSTFKEQDPADIIGFEIKRVVD